MISALYVGCGAFLGALCRWGVGILLNPLTTFLPSGTLFVNLAGGYLIGLIAPLTPFSLHLATPVQLFMITGFLGSFTSFSTFSADVLTCFIQGQWLQGIVVALMHVCGSLLMTYLGVVTIQALMMRANG